AIDYFAELFEVHTDENIPIHLKYTQLRTLLEKITKDLTSTETLQFSNLFSRLSFVCDKFKVSRNIHSFRITANRVLHENIRPSNEEYQTHYKYLSEFISATTNFAVPEEVKNLYPTKEFRKVKSETTLTRLDKLRVELIEKQGDYLICDTEDNDGEDYIRVSINESDVNSVFKSVDDFWIGAQLYLVNIEIDDKEIYHPKFIILEPDYLVDISAIAECFQDFGTTELNYIKSKFEELPNTKHILIGNFANLVIDELFGAQKPIEVQFNDVFNKHFKTYPFEHTSCQDIKQTDNFKSYWKDCEKHFDTIKRVVLNEFENYNISIETASLEPAFLCDLYGIQGRLDILELNPKKKSKIVELKSGGVPFPDEGTSIKPNHKAQLYLYYQLVGVLNKLGFAEISEKTDGYILYSKVSKNNLRYDKPTLKRVQEILELRNKIILNEYCFAQNNITNTQNLINSITPEALILKPVAPAFKAILENKINDFILPIKSASAIEKSYFFSFVSFIAKEQYL